MGDSVKERLGKVECHYYEIFKLGRKCEEGFKMYIHSNSQGKSTLSTKLSTVIHSKRPVFAGFSGTFPTIWGYSSVD